MVSHFQTSVVKGIIVDDHQPKFISKIVPRVKIGKGITIPWYWGVEHMEPLDKFFVKILKRKYQCREL